MKENTMPMCQSLYLQYRSHRNGDKLTYKQNIKHILEGLRPVEGRSRGLPRSETSSLLSTKNACVSKSHFFHL